MSSHQDFASQIQSNMVTIRRLMAEHFRATAGDSGISASQYELLLLVYEHADMPLRELAERMHVTPGAITQLVEGLEAATLLKRTPSERDRRSVTISITRRGMRKLAAIRKTQEDIFKDLTHILTENEMQAMNAIQQKIIQHLKKGKV